MEDFSILDSREKEFKFGQFDHVRIYGRNYIKRLEKVGFNVDIVNISNQFSRYGLNKDEDIFIGKKV